MMVSLYLDRDGEKMVWQSAPIVAMTLDLCNGALYSTHDLNTYGDIS